jgi:predicted GNAT family acetyltransferase
MPDRTMKKLREEDRERAVSFLTAEPSYNVFTIGDIENFGFRTDFQDVWADVDAQGNMHVLLLRYYTNHVVYAHDDQVSLENAVHLLSKKTGTWMLSGKKTMVTRLSEMLGIPDASIEKQKLAELTRESFKPGHGMQMNVEWANDDNFHEVLRLQKEIDEFSRFGDSSEALVCNQKSKTGRTAMVRDNGVVVSSASSAAENSVSAMIIGVGTMKKYRNRGFASACICTLCRKLLDENKTVCLFYNNPLAASIYKKVGFKDIGEWAIANVESVGRI